VLTSSIVYWFDIWHICSLTRNCNSVRVVDHQRCRRRRRSLLWIGRLTHNGCHTHIHHQWKPPPSMGSVMSLRASAELQQLRGARCPYWLGSARGFVVGQLGPLVPSVQSDSPTSQLNQNQIGQRVQFSTKRESFVGPTRDTLSCRQTYAVKAMAARDVWRRQLGSRASRHDAVSGSAGGKSCCGGNASKL
jgi:hypothetical protein